MTGSSNVTEPTEMPMEYANNLTAYRLGIILDLSILQRNINAGYRCPLLAIANGALFG
jgi:hypothetical protein